MGFTITVANAGPGTASNLVVTDKTPSNSSSQPTTFYGVGSPTKRSATRLPRTPALPIPALPTTQRWCALALTELPTVSGGRRVAIAARTAQAVAYAVAAYTNDQPPKKEKPWDRCSRGGRHDPRRLSLSEVRPARLARWFQAPQATTLRSTSARGAGLSSSSPDMKRSTSRVGGGSAH
jgi:uncharacterized repeat protein (TIGR01451 family)